VLFPPLCLPAAEGKTVLNKTLSKQQADIVKNYGNPKYQIKFKTVEIYESILNYLKKKK
jgi:stage II sporulation protein R